MAIYHCDLSILKRSSGSSSVGSAAYRSGEKILDERTGITHDYTRKKGVLHTEIITPENVPDWAKNRHQLWNAVEAVEKRKDSQLAREIMVALPNELSIAQQLELVRTYITEEFTQKGMIADIAIHAPNRKGDDRNYHAHILLTMRNITLEGFGKKERAWNAKANIYQWREQWQHHTNHALKEAGLDCQIDGRSHAKKGLNKEPLLHLGFYAASLERKGIASDLGNENRAIEARNNLRAELHYELNEINDELDKLLLEKDEQTVGIDENKQTAPIEQQAIKAYQKQQVNTPINEVQLSANNSLNSEQDKYLNTQKNKNDLSINKFNNTQETIEYQSLEKQRKDLEQKAEAFKEQQEKLKLQIENSPDEKTQARLQLQARLEDLDFTKTHNKILASILAEEDLNKNASEINKLQHKARVAEQDYKKQADEWAACAVRDNDYKPLDQRSANKIDKIKKYEQWQWAKFEDNAKIQGWSLDRIERERKNLIDEIDLNLADSFDLDLEHGFEMEM